MDLYALTSASVRICVYCTGEYDACVAANVSASVAYFDRTCVSL